MSHIFKFSRWRPSFLHNHIQWNLSHISFSDFSGRDYDVFSRTWCHYTGIPCQNWGNPLKNAIFGRFRLVMCMPITELNDTIPVLFKTSIKASPHPLTPPLPHPPYPIPLPQPFLPHPFAPFCNPLPQQFGPPLPKVNRWLKIVNYFTCMRHLFCRW